MSFPKIHRMQKFKTEDALGASDTFAAGPFCDTLFAMRTFSRHGIAVWALCALLAATLSARADQLQMQNGDRYVGHILSMSSNTIVLESDVLGKISLPREKVSSVTFGAKTTPATPVPPAPRATATNVNVAAALRAMGGGSNSIEQVRQQMLTGADPAATQKYNELVGGLMTGRLNVNDIRNEAKNSIEQINRLKRELGPEAGDSLDSYLAILQGFVNETEPVTTPMTPTPAASPAPAPTGAAAAPAHPYAPVAKFGTNSAAVSPAK
jgi:hypothetical protein